MAVNPTAARLVDKTTVAVLASYALTTVHHIYGGIDDGVTSRLWLPVVIAPPTLVALAALRAYKRSGSARALATGSSVIVLTWVLVSGVLHGAYSHVYKSLLYLLGGPAEAYFVLNPGEHYPPDDIFFEVTGSLETLTAAASAVLVFRLVQNWRRERRHLLPARPGGGSARPLDGTRPGQDHTLG